MFSFFRKKKSTPPPSEQTLTGQRGIYKDPLNDSDPFAYGSIQTGTPPQNYPPYGGYSPTGTSPYSAPPSAGTSYQNGGSPLPPGAYPTQDPFGGAPVTNGAPPAYPNPASSHPASPYSANAYGNANPYQAPPYATPHASYGAYGAMPYGAQPAPQMANVPTQVAGSSAEFLAKNKFKVALRRLILVAFALVFLFWTCMTLAGFRYRSYDQGALTVRIYGRFDDNGTSTAKHYYSNGQRAKWDKKAQLWQFSDGSTFAGTLQEGFFVKGTYTCADYTYCGSFQNGNLPTGSGNITYADGTCYEGAFLDGVFHGQGKLTYPDGSRFIGEFAHGKKEGIGTLYDPHGQILQTGIYHNDLLQPV